MREQAVRTTGVRRAGWRFVDFADDAGWLTTVDTAGDR